MHKLFRSFWPAVIVTLVATVAFVIPGKELPTKDWFHDIYLDKWVHVGLFAALVIVWCLPFVYRSVDPIKTKTLSWRIALIFLVYGIVIEIIQGNFIPNRTFGVDDILADAIGCLIGFWFVRYVVKKRKH